MARNPARTINRGSPGRHFALAMAVIFVVMIMMIFFTRNKNTASPKVTTPTNQHRLP
ncbi:MAG TPA: hypothetical protein VE783_02970 [Candidatus Limnocylindrales bacterium]|jgi:hypothetical protein|nr:hypothetical protein [Candidatus Limnocylindrales bacterium]